MTDQNIQKQLVGGRNGAEVKNHDAREHAHHGKRRYRRREKRKGHSENERGTSGTVNVITKSELRGRAGPDNPGAAPEGNEKAR